MHRIAVVAVPPVIAFDLSIPGTVFGGTIVDGGPGYDVRLCTAEPGIISGYIGADVVVRDGLDVIADADTVIVTGTGDRHETDPRVLAALRTAAAAGKRIASICTGAFVLAQAGLLDGRGATTYWAMSGEFARRFPEVELRPDVLFVDEGQILTSAGLSAGIDLCLHMVRNDYGAAVAANTARLVVAAPIRAGDQTQLIETPLPPEGTTTLAATRTWALEHLHRPLSLADLATHAGTSIRTLTRRFHAETGLSPAKWLLHQRLDRARQILETTDLPVDQVAHQSGLGTADSLRQHLVRKVGVTPTAYRAAFATPGDR
ncbi:GlxA family transcriptional regulator [Streptodolium elevatio]|uniref:Helix-turn-helix domain-containing protein n=1 Tax=Streptodolium elevatio TaxID=3157996 RepID=A0ABV3DMS9_9ACTN